MATWRFVGTASLERRRRLETLIPFAELIDALKVSSVACFHCEPKQRDPSYCRATFCLDAGPELFDAVFNTASGYRGAYFDDPNAGLAANRRLLDALSPVLVQWAMARDPSINHARLVESMSLPSAKLWLAEDQVSLCRSCAGGWSSSYVASMHIENGRWEQSSHTHAVWGRQAPELSKLRILGGFVNESHQEWVADHKIARAKHIWEHGWT